MENHALKVMCGNNLNVIRLMKVIKNKFKMNKCEQKTTVNEKSIL